MNVNYNNLYCDYIGAIGGYSISDYIDITSNTLATNINELTSNTYHININNSNCLINTSNTNDYINGSLINVSNTYIYNNYQYGEIRFKIKDDNKIYVKIGRDGKLYLWITYTILRPEILEGWYEVSDILADYFFNLAIINFTLTGYGGDLVYLQSQINTIGIQILSIVDLTTIHTIQINKLIELQEASLVDEILSSTILDPLTAYQQITARGINSISRISTSSSSLLGLGGAGFFAWIASGTYGYFSQLAQERREKRERLNNIYGELLINSNTSNLDVPDINNPGKSLRESLYNNIYSNLSNINYEELTYNSNMIRTLGFVNCNITTQQLIPKLKSNEITLNNKAITKFSLDNLDDWIKTTHGIYYDITNGTIAINSTPTSTDFFRVGGQTTIQGDIICETKLRIGNTNVGLPTTGINGGAGDKLILRNGSSGIHPYSLGVNTNNMWYSAPSGATHNFYINGGTAITSISSTGLSTIGTINASTNLQENAVNLTAKYLRLDGTNTMTGTLNGTTINASTNLQENAVNLTAKYLRLDGTNTMTGTLNGTTINASTNLQENAVNLTSKYLRLDGTNVMTGQITGVSTLNATTGIFGQVATTNNTNTGAPSFGVFGGTGDKLILWAGAVGTTLPYSLGINASTLWYSVPTGATHKFYSGGGNPKMTILGNGNIGIGTDNPNYILHIRGANPTILRIETGNSAPNEVSGIEFGIPAFSSAGSAKITSTSIAGDIADLKFHTSAGLNQSSVKMTIRGDGNVGIGNANPSQILQVGNAGRLRISNGTTDYSLLGTIDTDTPATNTRIVVSGNTRGSGFAGNIDYVSTAGGSHIFYNSTTERMRILNNGNVGININNPRCHLEVAGIGCINNGSPYAVVANFMQSGSLTIGGINASYGGGVSQWTTNTAGLLLECSVNTEIAVHNANTRVASLMYYEGDANNRITIGRNMGWSAISSVVINGALSLKNSDWHKSFDNANRLYFANNTFTQYGNGGGVIGHDFINNTNSPILTLYNDTNVRCANNLEVVNYLYSKSYICTAEDYSYVVNWNGTTNSGWFVGLNKYWYSGHTCLNVSITALNAGGTQRICWFGRVYLSFATGANTGTPPANNGGVIQIITDYRNPASYSPTNYYIDVEERWDGAGNNVLFMRVANAVYGGTLRIKIRG